MTASHCDTMQALQMMQSENNVVSANTQRDDPYQADVES
jgi:hypothetical protein